MLLNKWSTKFLSQISQSSRKKKDITVSIRKIMTLKESIKGGNVVIVVISSLYLTL